MSVGPGKYDDDLTRVRLATKARGALLIILEGERGFGFSIQVPAEYLVRLPSMLRHIAEVVEKDLKAQARAES